MNTLFRKVTDDFWVAGQIDVDDVRRAADQGIRLIVNTSPEGEGPGQPPGPELAAAAQDQSNHTTPKHGHPTPKQTQQDHEAIAQAEGPARAYWLAGMRSVVL